MLSNASFLRGEKLEETLFPKYHVTEFCHNTAAMQGLLRMVFYQRCDVSRSPRPDEPWADRDLGWPRMSVFGERYRVRIPQPATGVGHKARLSMITMIAVITTITTTAAIINIKRLERVCIEEGRGERRERIACLMSSPDSVQVSDFSSLLRICAWLGREKKEEKKNQDQNVIQANEYSVTGTKAHFHIPPRSWGSSDWGLQG